MLYHRGGTSWRTDWADGLLQHQELTHLTQEIVEEFSRKHTGTGRFLLPHGIRSDPLEPILPVEGYRPEFLTLDDPEQTFVPGYFVQVDANQLINLFTELVQYLWSGADTYFLRLALESTHLSVRAGNPRCYIRESVTLEQLESLIDDFDEELLHDGFLAMSVIDMNRELEVELGEDKILRLWGNEISKFVPALERHGLRSDTELRVLSDSTHIHISTEVYRIRFDEMCRRAAAKPASQSHKAPPDAPGG